MVFHSGTSDRRVQCSRVGLEVKIYDTPAGGICASQGTFSSLDGEWYFFGKSLTRTADSRILK